ncbi:MAG: hypothetical protein O7H39_00705 [Gammaproteobacteria bacterium]|nr:hypothetical protein [Gammaproteobacteria bacterium]
MNDLRLFAATLVLLFACGATACDAIHGAEWCAVQARISANQSNHSANHSANRFVPYARELNMSFSSNAVAEIAGYRSMSWGDGTPIAWPVGRSVVGFYTLEEAGNNAGNKVGYSIMLQPQRYLSLGVGRLDMGFKQEVTLLLSADLTKIFQTAARGTRALFHGNSSHGSSGYGNSGHNSDHTPGHGNRR